MSARKVEAVIFDMDGVLTNTMPVSIKCVYTLLEAQC